MNNSIEWVGEERRNRACSCERVTDLERRMDSCREQVDKELESVHGLVRDLSLEVHNLRSDVHRMTESMVSVQGSLETIAATLTKLTDFPDTWVKVKGFWAVMKWFKENFIQLLIILGVLGYLLKQVMP